MKEYRGFIVVFIILLTLYIITEVNKPKPIDWTVTLSRQDKIPYGGFILFNRLGDLFPASTIHSYRTPITHQVGDALISNTAYVIIGAEFNPSHSDITKMLAYIRTGNSVFISTDQFQDAFLDTFHLSVKRRYAYFTRDSTSTNFVNPFLRSPVNYTFLRSTIDQYFSRVNSATTTMLGMNNHQETDFIQMKFGSGSLFLHTNPVCFSNYFLLHGTNAAYAAKALSYIPRGVNHIYWDEYYKSGRAGAATPLRYFLSQTYLRWALRLSLIALVLYVIFQSRRRQRIIPVIEPLKNASLDFVKTVSGVYFNAKDNLGIAEKKISFLLEFIRQRFNLPTQVVDEDFFAHLGRKSGVAETEIAELAHVINRVQKGYPVSDRFLLHLSNTIDNFYKQL